MVFFDCFSEAVSRYIAGAGRYDGEADVDPLVRSIRQPAVDFETGLILTLNGKVLRWGPGWWIHQPEGLSVEQQAIAAQLRGIDASDHSMALRADGKSPALPSIVGDRPRVWVFNGDNAAFPSAVFSDRLSAMAWIERHRVTGVLTEYPVGVGCYDLALADGSFTPSKPHHGTPGHVSRFSPSRTEHLHVRDGQPDTA